MRSSSTHSGDTPSQPQQVQPCLPNHTPNLTANQSASYYLTGLPSNTATLFLSATTPPRVTTTLPEMNLGASMRWPSVRRSVSSTTATRESSRHSEAIDVRSSRGRCPVSSSMDSHGTLSSRRLISRRGPSSERVQMASIHSHLPHALGTSIGETAAAPPLIAGLFEQEKTFFPPSLATTTVCTPREEPMTPQPPLSQYKAEAEAMSLKDLQHAIENLERSNRVSLTGIMRARDSYAALREGLNETYTLIEQRQENIANSIMRKLDTAKRQKAKLAAHLGAIEHQKGIQEARLQKMQRNIAMLSQHLMLEEKAAESRMYEQLLQLQCQRQELEELVQAQPSSLQQLEELVDKARKLAFHYTNSVLHHPLVHSESKLTEKNSTTEVKPALWESERYSCANSIPRSAVMRGSGVVASEDIAVETRHNSHDMLHYLERQIAVVEGLYKQAREAADDGTTPRTFEKRILSEQHRGQQEELEDEVDLRKHPATVINSKKLRKEQGIEISSAWRNQRRGRRGDGSTTSVSCCKNDSLSEVPTSRVCLRSGESAPPDVIPVSASSNRGVAVSNCAISLPSLNQQQTLSLYMQNSPTSNVVDVLPVQNMNKPISEKHLLPKKLADCRHTTTNNSDMAFDSHTNQYTSSPQTGLANDTCIATPVSPVSSNLRLEEMNANEHKLTGINSETSLSTEMHLGVSKRGPKPVANALLEEALRMPAMHRAPLIHTPKICVQNTARMSPPRPLVLESTPIKCHEEYGPDEAFLDLGMQSN